MPEEIKRPSVGGEGASKLNTVVWAVEEPSEFRKEVELANLGKNVQEFRVFYDASNTK